MTKNHISTSSMSEDNFTPLSNKILKYYLFGKRILFLAIGICFSLFLNAQVSKTVNLTTAGTLSTALTADELNSVTNLNITGTIDARDFKTMRDEMPMLADIDMGGANIVAFTGFGGTYNCSTDPTISCGTIYQGNTIPLSAFSKSQSKENSRLTSVVLPQSIIAIDKFSFEYCTGLFSLKIPASVTSIGDAAFLGCAGLTSIELPSGLKKIGYNAFEGCSELTSIEIPGSVYNLGDQAFKDCSKLTSVSMASYRYIISREIFMNCSTLVSIEISAYVQTISEDAFLGCSAMINVDSNNRFYSSSDGILYDKAKTRLTFCPISKTGNFTIPSSVTTLADNAFRSCSKLTSIAIPSSVTSIGFQSFEDCTGLITVDANNAIYSSLDGVMYNKTQTLLIHCPVSKIGNFTIPSSVTSIGEAAFYSCYGLTTVTIPSSVTSIGGWAFWECSGLIAVSIPMSVNSIGSWTFAGCYGLTSITTTRQTPLDLSSSLNVFNDVNKTTCILYVPVGSKSAYQAAKQWKDFTNIVELIPEIVANAGQDQFINEGTLVTLDGTSSKSNNNTNALSYKWTAPAGITLISETSSNPSFMAPEVISDTSFSFSLTINDGSFSSEADEVVITVKQVNKAPMANAGTDLSVNENNLVTLDGTTSVDSDNDKLNYFWTAPTGITLSSETASNPSFMAPEVRIDSVFTFELTVNDGSVNSTADQIKVTVKQVNKAPTANAGADQTVNENSMVTLDGSSSSDPDNNNLTYLWTAPTGITLSSETASNPTFTAPEVSIDTDYTFELTVSDGSVNSITDQVKVTVKQVNKAPIANAGTNQSVNENSLVTLDGSASTDPDQDELSYLWTAPAGITLSSETMKNPTFTAPEVSQDNIYRFILVVNDGKTDSDTSQVSIIVKQELPVLKLVSKTSDSQISSTEVAYQFYLKTGNSFSEESVTPVMNGDTTEFSLESGEWIVLASPTQNTSKFVPTYSGNTLEWINAEHIIIPEKGTTFKEITCVLPEVTKIGTGQISGYVYEKTDTGTKSISMTKTFEASGNPVPGALIRLYKKGNSVPVLSIFTDAQGFYKFEQLEISEYQIEVEIPGFTQSEKFGIGISADLPLATVSFGVNTTSLVITETNTQLLSSLKVYPNPVVRLVTVEVGRSNTIPCSILVYSMDGELVINQVATETKTIIDLSRLLPGTYLIQVCSGAERQSYIVIKR